MLKFIEERLSAFKSCFSRTAAVYSGRTTPLARSFRASLTEGESHPHGN